MLRIGINGFGRIGRQVLKAMIERYKETLEVVAVNDLSPAETNAHLFRYDSNYGRFAGDVKIGKDSLIINGHKIKNFALRDPSQIPWGDVGADVVIESTGLFLSKDKAIAHINGGAKKVIISAPAKDEDITIVMGVNHKDYNPRKHDIFG